MSYQVLARKWRPRSFRELVGQEHVVRALVNALENNRLHHAFLFTGTRGVGKTTIARILAKALNCHTGVTADPCGSCAACREIDEGRFLDLIEVDAASRTRVEDTRELLENVPYAPTHGRYKVYLIDEVHMLSTHSFNALLKTLEEPPPHVKFLLATTDPQRLPVTVLSRCLQFNLKRLPASLIAARLDAILEQEGIEREPAALALLARAGDGSLRDALSLLDQAIAFGGGRVSLQDASDMLGSIDQRHVLYILEALAAGDAAGVLQAIAVLDQTAPDYNGVLAELIALLQRIALAQVVPAVVDDDSLADPEAVRRLARLLAPEEVQLFYQIALLGRRDLPLSPELRSGFEMILLRLLCFRPAAKETSQPVVRASPLAAAVAVQPSLQPTVPPARPAVPATESENEWSTIVTALNLTGAVKQLALNCVLQGREGNTVRLLLAPEYTHLRTKSFEERLGAALQNYYGEPSLQVHIQIAATAVTTPARQQAEHQAERRQAAVEIIRRDSNVRALCDTFNAQVQPDSITPLD
jgi:DNA polymerase-3 subunit gamma/tau